MKYKTKLSYQQKILRVLSYIKSNLDEALDLSRLASLACMSEHHFHRIFSEIVGEGVKSHVRRLKLERSIKELAVSRKAITDIAFTAGYNTLEAFSRVIKAKYGRTPSQIRNTVHQEVESIIAQGAPKIATQKILLPAFDLAFVRHIGDYSQAYRAWLKLNMLTKEDYVLQPESLRIGFAYDHPLITPSDKCCYDACTEWHPEFVESGELGRTKIEARYYIMFRHEGPISTIDQSYKQFATQWLDLQKKFSEDQHSFMIYKNIELFSNPSKQVTECYFPLENS